MLRYCPKCQKEFEFSPRSVSGKDPLICPECGNVIEKNSRRPTDRAEGEKTGEDMGRAVGWFFRFCYIFYLVLGITGVIGYVLGIDKLLYITTAVSLLVYILQMVTGTVVFSSGIFFLPLGAVLGFLFFGGIRGACLGIHIVFLARHFLRDIVYGLIFRLVRMGSETKQT